MKKLIQISFFTAGLVLLGLMAGCQKENTSPLRLNLEKGKTYTLCLSSDQVINQTPDSGPQQIRKLMSMGFLFRVDDIDADGAAQLRITVHSARMELDQGGRHMAYNSSDKSQDDLSPETQTIAAFIGEQFTARITAEGRVIQVEGIDVMMENIVEKLRFPEGPEKRAARESLHNEFGSGALKEMIENMLAIYPKERVAAGESWSRVSNVSEGLPLVMKSTWTLKSLDEKRAVIGVQSEGKPYRDNGGSTRNTLFYDLQGVQEGTFVLDRTSGWIVEGTLTQRMWGRVLLNGAAQVGENVSWPLEIESTTTLGPVK